MDKVQLDCKNITLNPLIERINYLLEKVAQLEAEKVVVPAIMKPVAVKATPVVKKTTTKTKS